LLLPISANIFPFSAHRIMTVIRLVIALALTAMLGACGIKGALFIPKRPDIGAADGSKPAPQEPTR